MIDKTRAFLVKLLPKNKFSRNVSMLMGGTVFIQIVQLMVMPILTRLYSPDAFGLFASFSATVALLSIIVCLSYEQAILIPESEKEAIGIVRLSFLLLGLMIVFLTILLFFIGDYLLTKLNLEYLISYKYLLVVAVFLVGAFQIFNSFAIREKRFKEISVVNIYKNLVLSVVQLSLFSLSSLGLVLGFLVGSFLGSFRLKKIYIEKVKLRSDLSPGNITLSPRVVFKKYYKFPIYNMPSVFLNSVGRELPVILLTVFFSPAIAGFYYIANRIIQQPVSLVGGAISGVVRGYIPTIFREGNLASFYIEMNQQLLKIFAVPLAILAAILPFVFVYIFGEEWQEAGLISSILMPWVLMIALVSPLSTIPQVLNKQDTALYFEVLLLFLRTGGFLCGVYFDSYILAISLFSIGAVLGIFIKMLWIAKISLVSIKGVLSGFAKEVLIAFSFFLLFYIIISKLDLVLSIPIFLILFSWFCLRSLKFLVKGSSFG